MHQISEKRDRVPGCQLWVLERDGDFSTSLPLWHTVPDGLFFIRIVLFVVAKMNLESVQALPQSHFCSFEPQRHHRNAFSGFSHFPQLPVLLGIPNSLGVLCTQNHMRTRRPAKVRWASSMASRNKF
jgi:hypothetical protein